MPDPKVVTRFAPSPTGYLHVGGARTALFNWLLAKNTGGTFLLRIEDTDLARSTEAAVHALIDDLKWLGLNWDNAELVFQSKRLDVYNTLIDGLIAKGQAYEAFETTEELAAMRQQAERAKRPFIYRRREYTDAEKQKFKDEGRTPVIRFAMPVKEWRFRDEVLDKDVVQPPPECQDFVIRKADGMPTYHFGVVVDDAEMGITHVLRGLEHLKNTFYHIALMEALGYERPKFVHLPVILNIDGSKMGKRDRDKKVREATHNFLKTKKLDITGVAVASNIEKARLENWLEDKDTQLDPAEHAQLMPIIGLSRFDLPEILVRDFRESGYLPEAMNNFLALLGWSAGGDVEQLPMEELIQRFSIGGIGKSNAKFDRKKLLAFNTDYLGRATPERKLEVLKDWLSVNVDSPLNKASDEELARVIAMNDGTRVLHEMHDRSAFLFVSDEKLAYDDKAVEKQLKKNDNEGFKALAEAKKLIEAQPAGASMAEVEAAFKAYCEANELGLGKLAQPLRVALSGTSVSPPIFDVVDFLGKERTLGRIERCLKLNA